ncbi:MAG: hypothetical protein OSA44_04415 [Nitrospinaceae bacterium]|jgi:hypothetical protein|nr:hypothetical protein [Nitrospinaceae bacterium]
MTSKNEFLLAEDHLAKNELSKAVNHYERALRWFLPFSRTPNRAAEKLWEIAQNQQTQNQNIEALKTYRILRSAFYSVRSIYTPGKKWIHLCNEKIAHLMAFIESQERPGITFSEKKSEYMDLMETDRPPFTFPSIMSAIGFFGWVSSILLFIFKALSRQGHLKKRPAILFVSTFLLFYNIWIWGMFNA